jgi:hypothetical protein
MFTLASLPPFADALRRHHNDLLNLPARPAPPSLPKWHPGITKAMGRQIWADYEAAERLWKSQRDDDLGVVYQSGDAPRRMLAKYPDDGWWCRRTMTELAPALPVPVRCGLREIWEALHCAADEIYEGDSRDRLLLLIEQSLTLFELQGVRPPEPTSRYCLVPPNKLRWVGAPAEAAPRIYELARCVLDAGGRPLHYQEVPVWAEKVPATKTVQSALSTLNQVWLDIGITNWSCGLRGHYIVRKPS